MFLVTVIVAAVALAHFSDVRTTNDDILSTSTHMILDEARYLRRVAKSVDRSPTDAALVLAACSGSSCPIMATQIPRNGPVQTTFWPVWFQTGCARSRHSSWRTSPTTIGRAASTAPPSPGGAA